MLQQQQIDDQEYSTNLFYQIIQFENQLINSQTEHSRNESVYRTYNYHLEKLSLIYRLLQKMPRFDWYFIQSEIDRMYKLDNTITGCIIHFDFKDLNYVNRAFLKYSTLNTKLQDR